MPVVHVMVSKISKKRKYRPPPSLVIMGPKTNGGSYFPFLEKNDLLSNPLIGVKVEWHLFYADAKHTMGQQHNVEALHSLSSSVSLHMEWKKREDSCPNRRLRRGVM
ncbi:hypothetical protein GOODEAATRI_020142 [Goodea atripinnis]|uniref:Uncharacterized protein n=1 Tax=Goodea atripinnis TaxID=208336 RepID=A0ABV0MJL7_9TELE